MEMDFITEVSVYSYYRGLRKELSKRTEDGILNQEKRGNPSETTTGVRQSSENYE